MKSRDPIHLESREAQGARLYSPSAGRNKARLGEEIGERLPEGARVLEIASGTGEHAAHICALRDDVIWQPSDPNPESRESQNAWAEDFSGRMKHSVSLNTMLNGWWEGLECFDAIFCANMIHIAPWAAALGLAKGAGQICQKGGQVFLYGPFLEGDETAPSNLEFDQNLKNRNPDWGVRSLDDVKHIFADAGLDMDARIVMPANNRLLVFSKH